MKNKINKPLIEIKNLTKKYRKKTVFQNLNLTVYEGDRVALLGPNGCGKTTLVEMICGLRKITNGKITFPQGKSNFFHSLGVQFQTNQYPTSIRLKDLIYLYSSVYQQNFDTELKKIFEIDKLEEQEMNSLSFGENRKVELFILLATKLKFLILDEMTSGVDIYVKLKIIEVIKKHVKKNKISLIYISHNMDEINAFCNRLVILTKNGIESDIKITKDLNVGKKMESVLFKK